MPYFPAHLRSDNERDQHWTQAVDKRAKAEFADLSEKEIRRRQDLCADQIGRASRGGHTRALIDLQRQDHALQREMLNRC